jgi:hypothetical protein
VSTEVAAQNQRNKKADVAKHPEGFHHVGLLFASPPDLSRVALHLAIRRHRGDIRFPDMFDSSARHQKHKEDIAYFVRLLKSLAKPQENSGDSRCADTTMLANLALPSPYKDH